MAVTSLGYVIIESTDIGEWRSFGTEALGLMADADGPDGSLRLRIDDRPFRIAVVPGKADRFVAAGWELPTREAFEQAIGSLQRAGVQVERLPQARAEERCVSALASCADPAGNRLELYWGRALDYRPFASPQGVSGFVAGELGMGHVVLPAPDLEPSRAFYKQHLGFGDTDEIWLNVTGNPADPPLGLYFMHAANRRHHSLALMGAPSPVGAVHIMVEARTLDDVGYALDRCIARGVHISSSLGRHSNDLMVSFYAQTPAGFDIEFGCEGLQPDWSTWVPTRSLVPDLWGHRWAPPPAPKG